MKNDQIQKLNELFKNGKATDNFKKYEEYKEELATIYTSREISETVYDIVNELV